MGQQVRGQTRLVCQYAYPFGLLVSEKLFFRSRTRLQYFEEEDANPFPEQKLTLFHRLSDRVVLAYEAIGEKIPSDDTLFDEDDIVEPDDAYTPLSLLVRSRFKTRWPWLYVEFWPILAFPEELDYSATLAARIRLEVIFGHIRDDTLTVEE